MLGTIFYTSLFIVIIFVGGMDYYTTLFDKVIVRIELVLYGFASNVFNTIFIP